MHRASRDPQSEGDVQRERLFGSGVAGKKSAASGWF
jgi:hypothetical protein